MDTYDSSVEFKKKHPEAEVSAQSLIALSSEQTEQLKSSSKFTILCPMATPVLSIGASLFCTALFAWNLDMF